MPKGSKFIRKYSSILFCITFLYFFSFKKIYASNNSINSIDVLANKKLKSQYLLGPGDNLFLDFKGIPSFSANYTINRGGEVYLPELGSVLAIDKTLEEFRNELLEKYEEFVYEPDLELVITEYRPVTIFIGGEINKPGLYTIRYETKTTGKNVPNFPDNFNQNIVANAIIDPSIYSEQTLISIPKLFDALKKGEGFTEHADLSEIVVIRKNAKSKGGGKISTNINLISLLKDGDQSQNIILHDEDSIFIKKSAEIIPDQLNAIYRSNVTPDKINVFVNGNIMRSGIIELPKDASLNEAIAAAGGKKINSGKVEFIRLKRKQKSIKKSFSQRHLAAKGSQYNPILLNGDIINIKMNLLGKTTTTLKEISNPIISGYGLIKIFD